MRELEDEGKVMALADYAAPIADEDNPLLSWIRVRDGVIETDARRATVSGAPWRGFTGAIRTSSSRIWRSAWWSSTCVALARDAVRLTGLDRLALAGGVVSNIRAARRIRLLPEVEDVYVFPHMGDGGLALGAAVAAAAAAGERIELDLTHLDLGPDYRAAAIAEALRAAGFAADPVDGLASRVADCSRPDESSCGFRAGWRTARERSGTAACWRARIASTARPAESRAQAARLVSAVLSEHARERSAALLADWSGPVEPLDDDGVRRVETAYRTAWPA